MVRPFCQCTQPSHSRHPDPAPDPSLPKREGGQERGVSPMMQPLPPPPQATCIAMLSHCRRVRLCATPETAAHQAPIPGVLQARTLEWVAMPSSRGSS